MVGQEIWKGQSQGNRKLMATAVIKNIYSAQEKVIYFLEIVHANLHPHWGLLLREKICFLGSKFFCIELLPSSTPIPFATLSSAEVNT